LLHTGRRGGVPVLWVSSRPTGLEGAAVAPGRPRLMATLALDAAGAGGPTVETEVEPSALLAPAEPDDARACQLRDASGTVLARQRPRAAVAGQGESVRAEASVLADGWSARAPWRLACEQPEQLAVGRVEPLTARYRATLTLNLAAMG